MSSDLQIGPANYAGQAHEWARSVQERTAFSARSFSHAARPSFLGGRPAFTFPSDQELPYPRLTTGVGRRRRLDRLGRSGHVLLDGFVPVGSPIGHSLDADIDRLTALGSRVGLISHGSDLRHPEEHQHWYEHSYFNHADSEWNRRMTALVEANQSTLARHPDIPLFVSTPDLLVHQPRAQWLPLVVPEEVLSFKAPRRLTSTRPVVLHIPSRRQPPIKGTQFIDPVLSSLHSRGVIEYISPTAVGHDEMLRLMRGADVVVDQMMAGAYGLTAVEAMASGCVVVAGMSTRAMSHMPEMPPVVDVTPESFEDVITAVMDERDHHAQMAIAARAFAKRWHDGQKSAEVISAWIKLHPARVR